ncbi:MAG: GNAT family N-acetyltransferase [Prevotella sp.]
MGYKIEIASIDDVPALLRLQHKAFGPLVEELHWNDAPNMTETIEQAYEGFAQNTTLKIEDEHHGIIASVRGNVTEGRLWIGRLMVLPEHQHKGLGRRLLKEIQSMLPHNRACFGTCLQVKKSMELYESEGFRVYDTEDIGNGLTWAFMEKYHDS